MTQVEKSSGDIQVQCIRCRYRHLESERQSVDSGNGFSELVCPRCNCKSFYDMRPQAAWCWSSGLIELGDESAAAEGGIVIAHGPKAFLHGAIAALARHGRGASEGTFLVPGVPEAGSQQAKGDALATWLKWCAGNNGHKGRHGVIFIAPKD
jgi:DNA-directed RNA polymerase subunit RPC12/RpoP